jgi:DMSO/TMAO reductase YedYZ molybdopterin-dependent catalytic subunit
VLQRTCRIADHTAVTLKDLEQIFRTRPIRCIKTMQCLLDAPPSGLCSNGFWEGVSLRDVLARLGRLAKVRRLFYSGYYEDPKHRFASSLSLSEVLETPPGHLPVFLAFRLNGAPLPIERGGPVRMLVPEAYGFKSIKWLNRIVLTNDYRANDSYAEAGNDPQSPMKTLARLDVHAPRKYAQGQAITMRGVAVVGASGLERVEYWLREDQGTHGTLDPDDPAWRRPQWKAASLLGGRPVRWAAGLPEGQFPDGSRGPRGSAASDRARMNFASGRWTGTASPSPSPGRVRSPGSRTYPVKRLSWSRVRKKEAGEPEPSGPGVLSTQYPALSPKRECGAAGQCVLDTAY